MANLSTFLHSNKHNGSSRDIKMINPLHLIDQNFDHNGYFQINGMKSKATTTAVKKKNGALCYSDVYEDSYERKPLKPQKHMVINPFFEGKSCKTSYSDCCGNPYPKVLRDNTLARCDGNEDKPEVYEKLHNYQWDVSDISTNSQDILDTSQNIDIESNRNKENIDKKSLVKYINKLDSIDFKCAKYSSDDNETSVENEMSIDINNGTSRVECNDATKEKFKYGSKGIIQDKTTNADDKFMGLSSPHHLSVNMFQKGTPSKPCSVNRHLVYSNEQKASVSTENNIEVINLDSDTDEENNISVLEMSVPPKSPPLVITLDSSDETDHNTEDSPKPITNPSPNSISYTRNMNTVANFSTCNYNTTLNRFAPSASVNTVWSADLVSTVNITNPCPVMSATTSVSVNYNSFGFNMLPRECSYQTNSAYRGMISNTFRNLSPRSRANRRKARRYRPMQYLEQRNGSAEVCYYSERSWYRQSYDSVVVNKICRYERNVSF